MTGKTHVAIGFAAAVVGGRLMQQTSLENYPNLLLQKGLPSDVLIQFIAMTIAVGLGSMAPDLDQPGSTLSRDISGPLGRTKVTAFVGGISLLYLATHLPVILSSLPYLSAGFLIVGWILLMMAIVKHRGLTHSLLGMGLACIAVHWGLVVLLADGVSFASNLFLPFLIGYGAHLVADSFTNSGIAPLYLPFIPITQKHWHFPLHIRTGSFADRVVLRLGAIVFVIVGFAQNLMF
ncbi:MAG TPA: metal-dependent hydrolase [Desulfosporosinus sp.]|nr:metal-dependent hydrolase [Desulfosporosinus sp.]